MQVCGVPTPFQASPSHILCLQDNNLIEAAKKGELTDVKALLKAGADIEASDKVRLFRLRRDARQFFRGRANISRNADLFIAYLVSIVTGISFPWPFRV